MWMTDSKRYLGEPSNLNNDEKLIAYEIKSALAFAESASKDLG